MVILAGARPVFVEATEESGFKIDLTDLRKAITDRTKAIVINSPSNPTGSAYQEEELRAIAELALEKGILIVSDEIYEKIVYDGFRQISMASLGEEIRRATVVINGVSKTYSMTGWRIGYAAGQAELIGAMSKIQGQSTSNPTSIAQKAAVEALRGPQDSIEQMVNEFRRRRDYVVDRLNSIPGITCFRPQGAFYVFPRISHYFGASWRGREIKGSADFAEFLLEEARVAVVAGIGFGADEHIRISFATSMENLEKGLSRIEDSLKKLS